MQFSAGDLEVLSAEYGNPRGALVLGGHLNIIMKKKKAKFKIKRMTDISPVCKFIEIEKYFAN